MEQVIVNALYLGSQYAMIALGLTLIFALMNVLNFAHGQMYVLGGFVTYTIYGKLGLPFVVALLGTAVTLAIVGALIEYFLFRPVIKRSVREESTMLLAAGIAFLLDAVILLVLAKNSEAFRRSWTGCSTGTSESSYRMTGFWSVFWPSSASPDSLLSCSTAKQEGAPSLCQDRVAAELMGVNVDRYSMIGFALGAMLAGLVGGLLVTITGVNLGMGGPVSIKAFMMVMIGGAGVISGRSPAASFLERSRLLVWPCSHNMAISHIFSFSLR